MPRAPTPKSPSHPATTWPPTQSRSLKDRPHSPRGQRVCGAPECTPLSPPGKGQVAAEMHRVAPRPVACGPWPQTRSVPPAAPTLLGSALWEPAGSLPARPHGGSEGQSGLSSLRLQAPLFTPQPLNSLCKSLRNKLGRQEERQLFPAKMGSPGSQQP